MKKNRMVFKSNKPAAKRAMKTSINRGLTDAGMIWHGDATRITPVDDGPLRASLAWVVSGTKYHRGEAEGKNGVTIVEYEVKAPDNTLRLGSNQHYAPIVHEDLNAQHDGNQQAKFIEGPLRQRGSVYVEAVEKQIEKGMK